MCESRDEMKATSYEMGVLYYFLLTMMELAAHESRCEEHENDLSMHHKDLNLKRANNDMGEGINSVLLPFFISFSLVSRV